jgi:heme-degrading monooxygenase HmoA
MNRIASFHLIRERPGRAMLAMARLGTDRLRMNAIPGLHFWRLLGTGQGSDTGPSADLRRTALFAVWESEEHLEAFLADSPLMRRWSRAEEYWYCRLRRVGGHGTWRKVDPLDQMVEGDRSGPVAIITRADVRLRSWRAFSAAGHPVSKELAAAAGLLAVVGIGEAPVGRLGTFSLWESLAAAKEFALRGPEHREVVRRTRDEDWYGEELFARFEPYAAEGNWAGRNPLG